MPKVDEWPIEELIEGKHFYYEEGLNGFDRRLPFIKEAAAGIAASIVLLIIRM